MRAVRVTASSTFYRTVPLAAPRTAGVPPAPTARRMLPEQPPFLNGVWQIETDSDARLLKFAVLRGIEDKLGRVRTAGRYAPRTLDLDLLVYGSAAINEPDLRVPDPDIRSRPFLALPLLELAPGLVLADNGECLADVCRARGWDAAGATLEPDRVMTATLRERIKP
jgi:2-amino-4-hydroxy-6-hydroxymethyldihydropteridine diphosphokinase